VSVSAGRKLKIGAKNHFCMSALRLANYILLNDLPKGLMAPVKRRIMPADEPFIQSKRKKENYSPLKRLRQEGAVPSNSSNLKDTETSASVSLLELPQIAKLNDEDAAFPRGGASVLTPLEYKQINIEATRDVLFEQKNASRSREIGEEESGDFVGIKTAQAKKRAWPKDGKRKGLENENSVKIEGLSYKVFLHFCMRDMKQLSN
jgi:rRNA biogenesis protein RRP5